MSEKMRYYGAYIEPKNLTESELKHKVLTWDLKAFQKKLNPIILTEVINNGK